MAQGVSRVSDTEKVCCVWAYKRGCHWAGCVGWQHSRGAGLGSEAELRSVSLPWPINHSQPALLQRLNGARCAHTRWSWCHPESLSSQLHVDRWWTQRAERPHIRMNMCIHFILAQWTVRHPMNKLKLTAKKTNKLNCLNHWGSTYCVIQCFPLCLSVHRQTEYLNLLMSEKYLC